MAEFNIRSDAVDVEQIMEQLRARLQEKRGVDYTEEQIRELASVKLDRFLDPKNVRSDLLEHFRRQNELSYAAADESMGVPAFEPEDVYRSSRGGIGRVLHAVRRLLRPILKLFINPGPLLESVRNLSTHARLNEARNRRRAELDVLMYEVLNNLVVEMTRLAIDMKNHRMRVESVAARLDFDERRGRALEQIVQFRTNAASGESEPASDAATPHGSNEESGGTDKRRRRRRRGRRRSGSSAAPAAEASAEAAGTREEADAATPQSAGNEPADSAGPGSEAGAEPSRDTSEP